MLGLTQQQLAEMIGVTYQQAHKYERGINRVSAGRLFEIARALSAPITYFYEGVGQEGPRQITPHQRMLLEIARTLSAPITYFYEGIGEEGARQIMPHQRMLLEVARNAAEIRSQKQQEAVSQLVRALAST